MAADRSLTTGRTFATSGATVRGVIDRCEPDADRGACAARWTGPPGTPNAPSATGVMLPTRKL